MTKITVYHKDYCPYCKGARQLLSAKGYAFDEIEVTSNPVQFAEMVQRSGRRTVPQIFVDDEHIGGFDDLQHRFANNSFPLKRPNQAKAR